jgi:3-phytase
MIKMKKNIQYINFFTLICSVLLVGGVLFTANLKSTAAAALPVTNVLPTVETAPVPNSGDAADDPTVWVDKSTPSRSVVIGTDKQGGLAVYDLSSSPAGKQLQYLSIGEINNVDIRYGFSLGGQSVDIVTAGNRTNNTLVIYKMNPSTRQLENVAARVITTESVYGSCMYKSPVSGKFYYFVDNKDGKVEQWELFATTGAKVDAKLVRSFDAGSQTEGCVADDELGHFYIGEEAVGIWKYSAEPTGGTTRTSVDKTTAQGGQNLVSNVEGLSIAYGMSGKGYLFASSQGDDSYMMYTREGNNTPLKKFKIASNGTIDGTSGTDGIDVTTASLGPAFPSGAFISQDGSNSGGNQNFKLVPLQAIISGISPPPTSIATATPRPTSTPIVTPSPTACPSVPPSSFVTSTISVGETATYSVWSRMRSQGSSANSFYLQFDSQCFTTVGDLDSMPVNQWTWVDYQSGLTTNKIRVTLTAGDHQMKIMNKETGTEIDRVILSRDPNCVPVDNGDNCVSSVPPTATPFVSSTPVPSPVSVSLQAVADSYVSSSSTNSNYGTSSTIQLDGDPQKIGYMRYDLTSLTGKTISSAKLRIRITDSSSDIQSYYLVPDTNWGEKTIRFNNKPSYSSSAFASSQGGSSGNWKEIDFTQIVTSQKGSLFSFAIVQPGGNSFYFNSREHSNKPTLNVIYY